MKSAYEQYKEWWKTYYAIRDDKDYSEEKQFEDHINRFSLYELMETLERWRTESE